MLRSTARMPQYAAVGAEVWVVAMPALELSMGVSCRTFTPSYFNSKKRLIIKDNGTEVQSEKWNGQQNTVACSPAWANAKCRPLLQPLLLLLLLVVLLLPPLLLHQSTPQLRLP